MNENLTTEDPAQDLTLQAAKNDPVIAYLKEQKRAWAAERAEAGLQPGQPATRLKSGKLVALDSPEYEAEWNEFMSRFRPVV